MPNKSLRDRAEQFLASTLNEKDAVSALTLQELIHELSTYQVELEMQNDELKKTQEEVAATNTELEKSKNNYANLYNFAPVGLLTFGSRGIIVEANEMSSNLLGVTKDRLIGENITTFIAPEDQAKAQEHYLQALEHDGKQVTELKVYNHPPGATYLQLETVVEKSDQETQSFCKSALFDISERKLAEENRDKLFQVIEQSPNSTVITDLDGNVEYVNPGFIANTGYKLKDVLGKPLVKMASDHPPEFYNKLYKNLSKGETWQGHVINQKKNGDLYWELQSHFSIKDSSGNASHLAFVSLDETERIHAEEITKKYAKELKRSNDELQSYAQIASHDLHEPLRKIISFSERVLEGLPPIDDKLHKYLIMIQRSTLRMNDLLNDLLTYSQVTTKAQPFEEINLDDIIMEVIEDLELLIEKNKAKIDYGSFPVIEGDRTQIRQLLQNLISNSLKYHNKDTQLIILIKGELKGSTLHLTIEDNGIGFDQKYCDKIFKPFQRLHGRDEFAGTGIGLAICKKIVDQHNGSITAKSKIGKGTIIMTQLPITSLD